MSRAQLKENLKQVAAIIPLGEDLYLKYVVPRSGEISYRGFFDSYGAALAERDKGRNYGYDEINKTKVEKVESGNEDLDSWFHDYDYPFLFWVNKLAQQCDSLLELGGSLGHFYFSSQKYCDYPEGFRWQIAELPEAVELGRELVSQRNDKRLTFIDSARLNETEPTRLFISAGTLQYMSQDLDHLLSELPRLPEHIVLHMLPAHPTKSFWTLQDLRVCELPYRIYSQSKLQESLFALGYSIHATWAHDRQVKIPFQLKSRVKRYIGIYASQNSECNGI